MNVTVKFMPIATVMSVCDVVCESCVWQIPK